MLHDLPPAPDPAPVDAALRERRSHKVLADPDRPLPAAGLAPPVVAELLAAMGRAPFHRPPHAVHASHGEEDGVTGPWRAYVLGAEACRALLRLLRRRDALAGKIPGLLAAADTLVLVTWLPDPPAASASADAAANAAADAEAEDFEPTVANVEHIAAAGAAVQNLLVAATARGLRTFWSSGGVLRTPPLFEAVGIPARERLLGAVFVTRPDLPDVRILTTKLGDRRAPVEAWARHVAPEAIG